MCTYTNTTPRATYVRIVKGALCSLGETLQPSSKQTLHPYFGAHCSQIARACINMRAPPLYTRELTHQPPNTERVASQTFAPFGFYESARAQRVIKSPRYLAALRTIQQRVLHRHTHNIKHRHERRFASSSAPHRRARSCEKCSRPDGRPERASRVRCDTRHLHTRRVITARRKWHIR